MFGHNINGTGRLATRLDRRSALRGGGAMAGAAALLGVAGSTSAQGDGETLELDMACDGRTWRMNRLNEIGLPLMGDTFIVNGSIYPGGSFDNGVTGPDAPGAIGRWICQGTFLVDIESGAVPHVFTTVLFTLGDGISSTEGQIELAEDGLVSIGVDGGVEETNRICAGGYGRYAGAGGSVIQLTHSENETTLQVAPDVAIPAYNFRYTFHLGTQ